MNEPFHVYPSNEKHLLLGALCECKPRVIEHGTVVVHNAFDGREDFEFKEPKIWEHPAIKARSVIC